MNLKIFALMLCVMPGVAYSAPRSDGGGRSARASARSAGGMATMNTAAKASANKTSGAATGDDSTNTSGVPSVSNGSCRDAYRTCMDEFCLQDESDGARCICSDNYSAAQRLLNQIKDIQAEADNLLNVETQKARLGAKAKLVMDDTKSTKKTITLGGDDDDDDTDLTDDDMVGANLYEMASNACAAKLNACGDKSEMEEQLYSRMIVSDCKAFNTYLNEQKTYAEQNKNAAKLSVVNARLEVLDTTNKYNRGECLLAYKACVADKGGCGVHFENCLDKGLLNRRANACENVLDQCMAVVKEVKKDWNAEVQTILDEGEKYVENNKRTTCMAKTQLCLEENCSPQTNAACLTNPEVAAGICPIIEECEKVVTGFKQAVVVDQLKDLQVSFCEDDVEACLKEKCGANFTGPQCVGQNADAILDLCPPEKFRTCNGVSTASYTLITNSIRFSYNYKQMEACQNHFSERLGAVCGTDMSCLPESAFVMGLNENSFDDDSYETYRTRVIADAKTAVDNFFAEFEQDATVDACASAETPAGKNGLGNTIFNSAKMIAQIGAQNRALRQLETRRAEISRKQSVAKAEQNCKDTYKVEEKRKDEDGKDLKESYSYIRSVSFEPSLRNCHVCRMQQVCETGGEDKWTSALKAGSGGLVGGAAMGTQVNAGWGTAIGGVVGAVGAGFMGLKSGGKETFCQEIESCEDINF